MAVQGLLWSLIQHTYIQQPCLAGGGGETRAGTCAGLRSVSSLLAPPRAAGQAACWGSRCRCAVLLLAAPRAPEGWAGSRDGCALPPADVETAC